MPFYDSVKDDVREEHGEEVADDGPEQEGEDDVAFDTLKEGADQYSEKPDEGADDTEIEVVGEGLADGGEEDASPAQGKGADTAAATQPADQEDATGLEGGASSQADGVARDEVVSVLKTIEQQNTEMLDVLRGIKRSLDTDS